MDDKFVTFCDIKKESTYTKYLKYLTLEKRVLSDGGTYAGGKFDYWVSFDDKCVEVTQYTYQIILGMMVSSTVHDPIFT